MERSTETIIDRVKIKLDQSSKKRTYGVLIISKIIVYFADAREKDYQEFVDNEAFYDEEELIESVA